MVVGSDRLGAVLQTFVQSVPVSHIPRRTPAAPALPVDECLRWHGGTLQGFQMHALKSEMAPRSPCTIAAGEGAAGLLACRENVFLIIIF